MPASVISAEPMNPPGARIVPVVIVLLAAANVALDSATVTYGTTPPSMNLYDRLVLHDVASSSPSTKSSGRTRPTTADDDEQFCADVQVCAKRSKSVVSAWASS